MFPLNGKANIKNELYLYYALVEGGKEKMYVMGEPKLLQIF